MDLSRFGRNYIETGDYIHRIFPLCGIRFISLLDHYDSKNDIGGPDLGVLIRTIVNSSYSTDVSEKIKATIRTKQQNGNFVAALYPYGYKKSYKDGKVCFDIDDNAAQVVKDIFTWASSGESAYVIAGRLNEAGISSPRKHIAESNGLKMARVSLIWTYRAVTDILKNCVYTGDIVMGKTRNPVGKLNQPQKTPKNEWIIRKNHHDPIVSKECFEKVQEILGSKKCSYLSKQSVAFVNKYLSNKLFCGICERKMKRRIWNQKLYFMCPRLTEARKGCQSSAISAENLLHDIFDYIHVEIERAALYKTKQADFEKSFPFRYKEAYIKSRLSLLSSRLTKLKSAKSELRIKAMERELYTAVDYFMHEEFAGQTIQEIESEIVILEKMMSDYRNNVSSNCWWVSGLLKYVGARELTEEMYDGLLKRITVKNGNVDIQLKVNLNAECTIGVNT
jgi:hypothetical protein